MDTHELVKISLEYNETRLSYKEFLEYIELDSGAPPPIMRGVDYYLALSTAPPGTSHEHGIIDEVSGEGYERVNLSNPSLEWLIADGRQENITAISFPVANSNWGLITQLVIIKGVGSGDVVNCIDLPEPMLVGLIPGVDQIIFYERNLGIAPPLGDDLPEASL